jgi:hypothetical protein
MVMAALRAAITILLLQKVALCDTFCFLRRCFAPPSKENHI